MKSGFLSRKTLKLSFFLGSYVTEDLEAQALTICPGDCEYRQTEIRGRALDLHQEERCSIYYNTVHSKHNNIFNNVKFAAETWCLKAKTVAKLNSTEMDFWRRSARISRKDKIRNNIIKQKINVTRSLLEDIKTKQLQWYGHVQRMEEGRLPKKSY